MMNVQEIIDSGQLPQEPSLELLNDTIQLIDFQLEGMRAAQWGEAGKSRISALERLREKAQKAIDSKHGADGMTHLNG